MANKETNIQNNIMLEMSACGILTYRQVVGKYRPLYNNAVIKVGVEGMADVGGVMPVKITPEMVGQTIGVAVNVEVKTATGKQQANQKVWEKSWKAKGGIYIVGRDHERVIEDLQAEINA